MSKNTGDDLQLRRDAEANRERVLAAAVTAVLREGPKVPMLAQPGRAESPVGFGTIESVDLPGDSVTSSTWRASR
jgi:hypothetical protein